MKISCPDCQASYDVNLPNLTEKGVQVKCAKCQQSFLVTPAESPVRSTGSPLSDSLEDKNQTEDDLDGMLDRLIDEEYENGGEDLTESEPDLDNMLDDLISGDTAPGTETTTEDQEGPDLDNMLDDRDDTQTSTEEGTEETPLDLGTGEESELETMADDATDEKTTPDSLKGDVTSDSDEDDLDELLDDILNDDDEETEKAAPPATETKTSESETSVDDILGNILPESGKEESTAETEEEEDAEPETEEESAEEATETEAVAETEKVPASTETLPSLEEMSEEDMWAEAFADQEATEEIAEKVEEATAEGEEEEKSEEDMWAEAFADQEATEESAEKAEEETAEGEEEGEGEEGEEEGEEDYEEEEETQDAAAELGISEDDYPEEDEEDYEEEEEARIKIGPISVPATLTGKLMLAGGVLGLLVTAGGGYFAWKTFAPPELTELEKPTTEVPEGLTPKPDKGQAPPASGEKTKKAEVQPPQPEKTAKPAILGEVGEETKSEIAQELAKSKTLSESSESVEVVSEDSEGLQAALSPEARMVKLSTIMPVAFDVNDIKVLSFTLEITFTDEASAQVMQSTLPFFEEVTVKTVESFLTKKFYNDILYVKEKLEKRLQTAYNENIDSAGRVKKIKFEEFEIQ